RSRLEGKRVPAGKMPSEMAETMARRICTCSGLPPSGERFISCAHIMAGRSAPPSMRPAWTYRRGAIWPHVPCRDTIRQARMPCRQLRWQLFRAARSSQWRARQALGHEHPFVAVLLGAVSLGIAEVAVEGEVLGHHLVGVEPHLGQA